MTKIKARIASNNVVSSARYPALVAFIVLCFAAAAVGGFFPPDDWYASLNRPTYAPPNWVFGPVWTALYLMMAVAGWLVWKTKVASGRSLALTMFGVQLLLNAAWSAIFFGAHQPGWALLEMAILWLTVLSTIVVFKRQSPVAGLLLVPYLAWVSFAAFLNYGFWSLN